MHTAIATLPQLELSPLNEGKAARDVSTEQTSLVLHVLAGSAAENQSYHSKKWTYNYIELSVS